MNADVTIKPSSWKTITVIRSFTPLPLKCRSRHVCALRQFIKEVASGLNSTCLYPGITKLFEIPFLY
jgi:hypothetical protein